MHALVDFPLQIPAIGMLWAALIVVPIAVYRDGPAVSVPRVRWALATLAGMQLLAMGWQTRERLALDARATGNVAALATVSPWHHEVALAEATRAFGAGLRERATQMAVTVAREHPGDPAAQRAAARTLAEIGALKDASSAASAAIRLAPYDWRAYAIRARLLEALHPEQAADAWLEVVARGAPARVVRTGWRTLPLGLPWIEAAREQPGWYQRGVARTVASLGDPEAALIGFDQVRQDFGGPIDLVHVRLLGASGETGRALALVESLLDSAPRHRHGLRVRAEVLEAAGRREDAVEQWVDLAQVEAAAQGRAVRASAEVRGPDAALALVSSLEGTYGPTGVHASARVEQARALLASGRAAQCVGVLERSGAIEHDLVGPRARKLARMCRSEL